MPFRKCDIECFLKLLILRAVVGSVGAQPLEAKAVLLMTSKAYGDQIPQIQALHLLENKSHLLSMDL